MQADWLIIDGYSLLHSDTGLKASKDRNFTLSRQHLVRTIQPALDHAVKTTIVFDGQKEGGPGEEFTYPGIEVLYSRGSQTADAVIEQLVSSQGRNTSILVVTSDRMILDIASASGAHTMSCIQFMDIVEASRTASRGRMTGRKDSKPNGPRLGDFFPASD